MFNCCNKSNIPRAKTFVKKKQNDALEAASYSCQKKYGDKFLKIQVLQATATGAPMETLARSVYDNIHRMFFKIFYC